MKTDLTNYTITTGENLPNHSMSMGGHSKFVRITATGPVSVPTFRTRQEAFRVCAHVLKAVEEFGLPDEIDSEEGEAYEFEDFLAELMPE